MKKEEKNWNEKPDYLKLKKGDKCVMHTCGESDLEKYHGKIWEVTCDEYFQYGRALVFLEGFSGSFAAKYLQKVDLTPMEREHVKSRLYDRLAGANYWLQNPDILDFVSAMGLTAGEWGHIKADADFLPREWIEAIDEDFEETKRLKEIAESYSKTDKK